MKFYSYVIAFCLICILSYCSPEPKSVNNTPKETFDLQKDTLTAKTYEIGDTIDSFNDVVVFYGGTDYTADHGLHYGDDGYLIGQKWQCVEFVKRYYYQKLDHQMPNVYGHAIHFFYEGLTHGALNVDRDLYQYHNGKDDQPQVEDLIVFDSRSSYGHVAIVSQIEEDSIQIIQQNMVDLSREWLPMKQKKGNFIVGHKGDRPIGWLRKKI